MRPRLKPLLIHAAHLAGAAAVTALLGFLSTNQGDIIKAIPPHWQGFALTVAALFGAFKYTPGAKP